MTLKIKNKFIQLVQSSLIVGLVLTISSCQPIRYEMEPIVTYTPSTGEICDRPSAFAPLTIEERHQEWANELLIGDVFARELDLYRAITAYKRARILLPPHAIDRRLQIDYDIILCYYLGNKYQEAINVFGESQLTNVNPLFPAYNNLVIMLYDAYQQVGLTEKAECIMQLIQRQSPETALDLSIYSHLKKGNLCEAECEISEHPCSDNFHASFDLYYQFAKSPSKARTLNALLPGAGYYYIGQKKAAWTSFAINALFIAAAIELFYRGYYAAGAITTSIEAGWYLGGINGAGIGAQEFNTRLYEGACKKAMVENSLFPILMFETSF